jgi:hypothetical protein
LARQVIPRLGIGVVGSQIQAVGQSERREGLEPVGRRLPDVHTGRDESGRIGCSLYEICDVVVEICCSETEPIMQQRLLESNIVAYAGFRQEIGIADNHE